MKGIICLSISIFFLSAAIVINVTANREEFAAIESRLDAAELTLAAKIPEPIKFYTIPGYDCETDVIPGHCTKWNITQAEYDKNNAHLFNEVK